MAESKALISVRSAAPNADDGLAFAVLLDEAHEGAYRMMLGRRAPDIVAQAFTEPGHDLSYQHVTFAERSGHVVGMASGYPGTVHRSFIEVPLTEAGWTHVRNAAFRRLTKRVWRFMGSVPDDDFYVRAVAVDAGHRGLGAGTALMDRMEDAAHAAGSERLVLDVAARNRDARRLYQRLGMSEIAESRRWLWLPDTNLIRMAKPL